MLQRIRIVYAICNKGHGDPATKKARGTRSLGQTYDAAAVPCVQYYSTSHILNTSELSQARSCCSEEPTARCGGPKQEPLVRRRFDLVPLINPRNLCQVALVQWDASR